MYYSEKRREVNSASTARDGNMITSIQYQTHTVKGTRAQPTARTPHGSRSNRKIKHLFTNPRMLPL